VCFPEKSLAPSCFLEEEGEKKIRVLRLLGEEGVVVVVVVVR
jgi:hypothetical protein